MSCLFLTEQDVAELIDMPRSIEIVEEAFRQMAAGRVHNVSRTLAQGVRRRLFQNGPLLLGSPELLTEPCNFSWAAAGMVRDLESQIVYRNENSLV
jgi:hypothetical protein